MQHRQITSDEICYWYGFRSVRIQDPYLISGGTLFSSSLPLHSFIFVSGSHAVSG